MKTSIGFFIAILCFLEGSYVLAGQSIHDAYVVHLSPSGKYIIGINNTETITLVELPQKEKVGEIQREWTISSYEFSRDEQFLAVGSRGGVVIIYDIAQKKIKTTVDVPWSLASSVSFSPGNQYIAVGTYGAWDTRQAVFIYNVNDGQVVQEISYGERGPHFGNDVIVQFSPDGKYLAVGSAFGDVWLYDVLQNYKLITSWKQEGMVDSLEFSSDNLKFLAVSLDAVVIHEIHGSEPEKFVPDVHQVKSAHFSHDNRSVVIASSQEKTVKIYDINKNETITLLDDEKPVHSALWSPDDQYIIRVTDDSAYVYDVKKGKIIDDGFTFGDGSSVVRAEFTPDGKSVLFVTYNGVAILPFTGEDKFPKKGKKSFKNFAATLLPRAGVLTCDNGGYGVYTWGLIFNHTSSMDSPIGGAPVFLNLRCIASDGNDYRVSIQGIGPSLLFTREALAIEYVGWGRPTGNFVGTRATAGLLLTASAGVFTNGRMTLALQGMGLNLGGVAGSISLITISSADFGDF